MNVRLVLALWVILSFPVWRSLLGANLDPDQAAMRLAIAGGIAVLVGVLMNAFVKATGDPGPSGRDTSKDKK